MYMYVNMHTDTNIVIIDVLQTFKHKIITYLCIYIYIHDVLEDTCTNIYTCTYII